ncbi:MAG: carbohydrate kinase family protein [Ktedonobacteraceae bacterium]|nr:carbohydrate kinase family protein [Ktedonobacteraceae bacterium]
MERAYVLPKPRWIACIGGVNIDRKLQTIGPLQYATSNPAVTTQTYGGVARNIAENLGRLGLAPVLIATVGDDQEGKEILRHCVACNVDVSHVLRLEGYATGTYTAILDSTGEMITALADMQICDQLTVGNLQGQWLPITSSSMIVADTNLPSETIAYLLEKARVDSLLLCLVPVSRPKLMRLPSQLEGIFLLITNMNEAEALADTPLKDQEDVIRACEVISRRGARNIIVTQSAQGAFWWAEDGRFGSVATEPVSVVDETGAGDAFVSGVIYALQSDAANFERACWFGIKVATLTLQTQKSVSDRIYPQLSQQWLMEWEETKRERNR